MKKKRNIIIASVLLIFVSFVIGFAIYNAMVDENTLSISEKKWIDNNNANLVSVAVPNDIPVFGTSGEGVFFDFIKFLQDDANLKINTNMVSYLSVCIIP